MSNWINITPSSGSGGGIITITASTIGEITRRAASVIASNNRYSVSAQTQVEQIGIMPNSISVQNLSVVSDIPGTGGTATKDICSYTVLANYDSGITVDITSYVLVTGELNVPYNTTEERKYAGELVLTFYYGNLSTTASTSIYQAARNYAEEYLTFEILSSGYISFRCTDSYARKTIRYSLNGGDWTEITSNTGTTYPSITVNSGDIIMFKGTNQTYAGVNYSNRLFGVRHNVTGNIMSLFYGDNFVGETTLPSDYCLYNIFSNSTVVDSKNLKLPATTLTKGCYKSMFDGCESLISTPVLSSTTLSQSCYENMFKDCTSILSIPDLPALTLQMYCYRGMFYGCNSIREVEDLPATSISRGSCDSMFKNCTSLYSIPEIPYITFISYRGFAFMFEGCTSLTTISEILSDEYGPESCREMFYRCVNITSAGTIGYYNSLIGDYAFQSMFEGCASLVNAPSLPSLSLGEACYWRMFKDCTLLVNAPNLPSVTLKKGCYQSMFAGCTSLVTAPASIGTTATTIAPDRCCWNMFNGCTSLTTAPVLPISTLCDYFCYERMFRNCSNLNYIKCLATNPSYERNDSWLLGVADSGTFVKDTNTDWTVGTTYGVPRGWTIVNDT